MGYGVKMRIYVFLEQCMHLCIFPGFQLSHLWGFYKSSLFLSCFHPQRHSRSSASPGTVVLSCRDGQSFHQSRGYWSQKKGYKSKYHRDMGYGVKMRIYVFLEQCMHFCIFPGFQLSHLWGFYKSSLFLSCFHPQRHSRSSSSPGTVVLSCRDGQSFHQSRGYWSQKKGYKSKYHRDMGYGVKMRIYVFLEQCMHFCIFPGFQLSHLWGFYKSSLFLSCFHPQRHSRSSASPGTVVLSCRDGQSFHQSRGYWSQKKGYKSKYHRDMGYGVKMRIYVFLQQCMHFCIFPGFQLSHLWGFYKSSLFL